MDGKTFTKFAKDTKLVDKKLTVTDVDLIFAKAKAKTERRITYVEFQNALGLIADKKGTTADAIKEQVLSSGGPTFSGTKADNVKFHDDKSLYTGVYAQGGPTNVDVIGNTASFGQSPNGLASKTQDQEEEKKEPKVKAKVEAKGT